MMVKSTETSVSAAFISTRSVNIFWFVKFLISFHSALKPLFLFNFFLIFQNHRISTHDVQELHPIKENRTWLLARTTSLPCLSQAGKFSPCNQARLNWPAKWRRQVFHPSGLRSANLRTLPRAANWSTVCHWRQQTRSLPDSHLISLLVDRNLHQF